MDEKLKKILDNYIEFKIRPDKNILTITCKKEELPCNNDLLRKGVDLYKEYLENNNSLIVILDCRLLKSINATYVWEHVGKLFAEIEPIAVKKVLCGILLIDNKIIKILVNSIIKIYPPKRPFSICNNYKEGLKFIENLNKKKN